MLNKLILPVIFAITLSTIVGFSQEVFADTIMLTGTIRDFCNPAIPSTCSAHPNFEDGISGVVTGIVDSNLGVDGKPVYVAVGGAGATTNAADFNQWYNDVAGVNTAISNMITLDNTITADPNIFTFASNAFFPIDGQLFGNQGRNHNFHFTYQIHTQFTYQGGEMFSFTGDDDLWVFINDQLVIDIGGVHGAASASVDLDTLGLTIGETYDFDLFFAERHTTQSNFRIDTSIELIENECPPGTIGTFPDCIPIEDGVVGGEIIPLETTSLILAGAQSFSWMIPVVLSGIGIGLFVVSRKSENS